jgi:hypothetical protein
MFHDSKRPRPLAFCCQIVFFAFRFSAAQNDARRKSQSERRSAHRARAQRGVEEAVVSKLGIKVLPIGTLISIRVMIM